VLDDALDALAHHGAVLDLCERLLAAHLLGRRGGGLDAALLLGDDHGHLVAVGVGVCVVVGVVVGVVCGVVCEGAPRGRVPRAGGGQGRAAAATR
jgi:hypothetical protein